MKKSHIEIIKEKLENEGLVTNLWAIQNHIWRLSDVIFRLRNRGMKIDLEFNTEKTGKNAHYYFKKEVVQLKLI